MASGPRLIFGCGYLGSRVARRWREAGCPVHVVTRSAERADALRREGYLPIVADVTDRTSLARLPTADSVLFAVGYDRSAGVPIEEVYIDGLRRVLEALPPETGRILYASSSGVYGQRAGEWVDEDSPTAPLRPGGRACLAAERLLYESRFGDRGLVLRLAGLYGPDRIPLRDRVATGEPLPASPDAHLNLIHVDDAAAAVLAADERGRPPRTYCVSDGNPVVRRDYYLHLARLLDAPPPTFEPPPPDSSRAARGLSDKKIRNARLLDELQLSLAYPDYREGLAAIVAAR
jgi:nucleoside-diphosphate-sugar epimerase